MFAKPDAFLSYTRFDDRKGQISAFRQELSDVVRAISGEPFSIFQDVDDSEGIALGQKWKDVLDEMLDQARFFIPILTPSFFRSQPCRNELAKFLELERSSGRQDLVLPIYWIRCPVLEEGNSKTEDTLAEVLDERQRWDWRQLVFEELTSKASQMALHDLAAQIERAKRSLPRADTVKSGASGNSTVVRRRDSHDLKAHIDVLDGTSLPGNDKKKNTVHYAKGQQPDEARKKAREEEQRKAKEIAAAEAREKTRKEAQAKTEEEEQRKAKEIAAAEAREKTRKEAQAKTEEEEQRKAKEIAAAEARGKARREAQAKTEEEEQRKAREIAAAEAREKTRKEAQAKTEEEEHLRRHERVRAVYETSRARRQRRKLVVVVVGLIATTIHTLITIILAGSWIEDDLAERSQEQLEAAGITGVSVEIHGRNAVLVDTDGGDNTEAAEKALEVVREIWGIRAVSHNTD